MKARFVWRFSQTRTNDEGHAVTVETTNMHEGLLWQALDPANTRRERLLLVSS